MSCLGYAVPRTLTFTFDTNCDSDLPAGSTLPINVTLTYDDGSGTWLGTGPDGHTFTGSVNGDCAFHVTGQYGLWCIDQVLVITGPPFSASFEQNIGDGTAGSDGYVCGEEITFDPADCPGGATVSMTVG